MRVLDRHAELLGDERPEPGRVQDAGHPENALARETGGLHGDVAHRVERVRDDDQDRIRRVLHGLLDDGPDDARVLGKKVVPAHPRLAREARRDDDDVRARRVGIVVRADDPGVVANDRGRLGEVEPLPWGRPSTMSTRTTSASPASAIRWAVVAPTFPAPMTVTLLRAMRNEAPFEVRWSILCPRGSRRSVAVLGGTIVDCRGGASGDDRA